MSILLETEDEWGPYVENESGDLVLVRGKVKKRQIPLPVLPTRGPHHTPLHDPQVAQTVNKILEIIKKST